MTSVVGRGPSGPSTAHASGPGSLDTDIAVGSPEFGLGWLRLLSAGIAVALVLYGVWTVAQLDRAAVLGYFGLDHRIYIVATERWLAGGPFYEPYQLARPYHIDRI